VRVRRQRERLRRVGGCAVEVARDQEVSGIVSIRVTGERGARAESDEQPAARRHLRDLEEQRRDTSGMYAGLPGNEADRVVPGRADEQVRNAIAIPIAGAGDIRAIALLSERSRLCPQQRAARTRVDEHRAREWVQRIGRGVVDLRHPDRVVAASVAIDVSERAGRVAEAIARQRAGFVHAHEHPGLAGENLDAACRRHAGSGLARPSDQHVRPGITVEIGDTAHDALTEFQARRAGPVMESRLCTEPGCENERERMNEQASALRGTLDGERVGGGAKGPRRGVDPRNNGSWRAAGARNRSSPSLGRVPRASSGRAAARGGAGFAPPAFDGLV
jgi:hypothetical protein